MYQSFGYMEINTSFRSYCDGVDYTYEYLFENKIIENGLIFTNNRKLIINNLPSRNSNNLNNPDIKKPGKQMQMRFSDDLR